jgi:hypothetical protein
VIMRNTGGTKYHHFFIDGLSTNQAHLSMIIDKFQFQKLLDH